MRLLAFGVRGSMLILLLPSGETQEEPEETPANVRGGVGGGGVVVVNDPLWTMSDKLATSSSAVGRFP